MSVVYESHTTIDVTYGANPNTFTITKPTGLAVGDLMIAIAMMSGTGTNAISSSASFTKIGDANDGSNGSLEVFAKIATSGDVAASNFSWTGTGTDGSSVLCLGLLRFSGNFIDVTTNIGVLVELDSVTVTNPSFSGSLTPTATDSLYVMGIGLRSSSISISDYAIANNNPTWTERFEIFENSSSDARLGVATATPTSASSSGDYSAILSSSAQALGTLLVINESISANGNHAILTAPHEIFAHTISVGTTGSHTMLENEHEIFTNQGKVKTNIDARWTKSEKTTKTWTDLEK